MRILLLLTILSAAAPAQADLIYPRKGRPAKGRVWDQDESGVTYNEYRTGIRGVTHGTVRLAAKRVKRVTRDPHPHHGFWRRVGELAKGSADEWVALGLEARKKKLKGLAEHAFVEALVRDGVHEAARKALGRARLKQVRATDPRLNAELKKKLELYLAAEDPEARKQALKELAAAGCRWPGQYLERAYRSAREKKGRTDDRILTIRSEKYKGVYTLFVPRTYDPFTPTPLVVGLHGGGRGGKDGKAVVVLFLSGFN